MADIPYVCLYMSYLQSLSPFTDAERGRLVMAMMNYAATGEVPQFGGNERFIWPSLQNQIDRDIETYQAKCARNRANGSKGGRPSKNQTVIPETERFLEKPKKPKEKEKEKEKKKEKENEREKEKTGAGKPPKPAHISPPSVDDVRAYCDKQGYTTIDPERFVSYYAARQWMAGQTAITDWRAAVDSWHRKDMDKNGNGKTESKPLWTVGTVV